MIIHHVVSVSPELTTLVLGLVVAVALGPTLAVLVRQVIRRD